MNRNQTSEQARILGISLSSRGFGYAIMEGENRLVRYGNMVIKEDKSTRVLDHIAKLINRFQPNVLALHNVTAKGAHRHIRIKKLHRKVLALAGKYKMKVMQHSNEELRNVLLGNEGGTKHEMAELLAKKFPDELATRLPPKRKNWMSEDARMDIFDAVGLAVVLQSKILILPKCLNKVTSRDCLKKCL